MFKKYEIEDVILRELRRQAKLQLDYFKVNDVDVGLVHYDGMIDIGKLADEICYRLTQGDQ
jgi:hypothetical protein